MSAQLTWISLGIRIDAKDRVLVPLELAGQGSQLLPFPCWSPDCALQFGSLIGRSIHEQRIYTDMYDRLVLETITHRKKPCWIQTYVVRCRVVESGVSGVMSRQDIWCDKISQTPADSCVRQTAAQEKLGPACAKPQHRGTGRISISK